MDLGMGGMYFVCEKKNIYMCESLGANGRLH